MTGQEARRRRPEAPASSSRARPAVKVMAFAASEPVTANRSVQAMPPSKDWKDATSWEEACGLNELSAAEDLSLEHEWQRWVNWQDLTRVETP